MPNQQILIVDDDPKLRELLKRIISREGFTTLAAGDIGTAARLIGKEKIEVVLCDVRLPDGSGIDFVKKMKSAFPILEMILLTAYGNTQEGVQAMKNGAFDYIIKGEDNEKIIPLIQKAIEKVNLQKRVRILEKEIKTAFGFDNIIGKSTVIRETKTLALKISPSDVSVLLLGETGTGKELFARAVHAESRRSARPFVAINCSAFQASLLESELFGHKAGAFTGAIREKTGLIEEADGGTLFLDEIGEMDLEIQSKLLRVLETNEFFKVGDSKPTRVDVRVISATNRDLVAEAEKGNFREDLLYRLNVFSLKIPSLAERRGDIPLLADYFREIFAKKMKKECVSIEPAALKKLQQVQWRGNIRELKNVIERAVIMAEDRELREIDFPLGPEQLAIKGPVAIGEILDLVTLERKHISHILEYTQGNKQKAANLLKIGIATLYRKIHEYKL